MRQPDEPPIHVMDSTGPGRKRKVPREKRDVMPNSGGEKRNQEHMLWASMARSGRCVALRAAGRQSLFEHCLSRRKQNQKP